MNFAKEKIMLVLLLVLSGCATHSSNMRVGNDMSYASLGDQRAAAKTIQVLDFTPPNGYVIGDVDAGRCHRNSAETSPAVKLVELDLKIAAYAMGADAIAEVVIEKQSALSKNCWYMLNGKAKALRLSSP